MIEAATVCIWSASQQQGCGCCNIDQIRAEVLERGGEYILQVMMGERVSTWDPFLTRWQYSHRWAYWEKNFGGSKPDCMAFDDDLTFVSSDLVHCTADDTVSCHVESVDGHDPCVSDWPRKCGACINCGDPVQQYYFEIAGIEAADITFPCEDCDDLNIAAIAVFNGPGSWGVGPGPWIRCFCYYSYEIDPPICGHSFVQIGIYQTAPQPYYVTDRYVIHAKLGAIEWWTSSNTPYDCDLFNLLTLPVRRRGFLHYGCVAAENSVFRITAL